MTKASRAERLMLELMNKARADAGLDPLRLALDLNTSAEDHSDWMLRQDRFSHTGAGGSSAGDRMADAGFDFSGAWSWGENIAWQSERGKATIRDDVRDLFDSLMDSPGHRANILSASFDYVGIGVERGDYNGWDAVMVTQNFGSTASPVALDNSAPAVRVQDITVAAVKNHFKRAPVEDALRVSDPEMDEIVFFEIRDREGIQNFKLRGEGVIKARDGHVIDADDLSRLLVRADREVGESSLQIRASDGEDWGRWAEFSVVTVSEDDFFA